VHVFLLLGRGNDEASQVTALLDNFDILRRMIASTVLHKYLHALYVVYPCQSLTSAFLVQ